jgi:hypothetical protein
VSRAQFLLSEQEIMWVRSAADASQNALPQSYLQNGASLLDPQPDQIHDVFSTVLGDAFHFMDRVRVPMHHELKKAYFYSLSEAFFAWDDTAMRTVKNVLREKLRHDHDCVRHKDAAVITDSELDVLVESELYYRRSWFRQCVPRRVLPPSKLYPRVRAVFEFYGPQIDSKSKQPLFSKEKWTKANNVLSDILSGYASDPPMVSFYNVQVNRRGEQVVDELGLPLIHCSRGTNATECVHKQLVSLFGTWHTGVKMADCVMSEFRKRESAHSLHHLLIIINFNKLYKKE